MLRGAGRSGRSRRGDLRPGGVPDADGYADRMRERFWELVRFGSVGGLAFVVDAGLFNLLRFGPGEVLGHKPLTAKVVSVAVATVVAWLGNRYWTFARRRTGNRAREFLGFAVANVVGMVIAVGCLAVSHYVLGFTSPLADNIAANVVGLGLGTIFRYLAYRTFVFTGTGSGTDSGTDAGTGRGADVGGDAATDSSGGPSGPERDRASASAARTAPATPSPR